MIYWIYNTITNTIIRFLSISSIFYIFISADIIMHVYAQFSFLWKSTKFKKIQVQFLEHREVIRPCTENINWSSFYRLPFKQKKSWKNAHAYLWRHFEKKLKIIFFSPPGGARELKLRPFDSESKTTSDCSNSLSSKKNHP